MKCIINGEEIRKVSNQQAVDMVKNGWAYCPKKLWKEKVRDKVKIKEAEKTENTEKNKEVKVESEIKDKPSKRQGKFRKTKDVFQKS